MGDKATLRMARQELEDLYLVGVPDDSVDLTFKDLASSSLPVAVAVAAASSNLPPPSPLHAAAIDDDDDERKRNSKTGLARSSTNIFTYKPLEDHKDILLQLPSPPSPLSRHHGPASSVTNNARAAATVTGARTSNNAAREIRNHGSNYRQRPGIPHSNICALCNKYVYVFRHLCLVCGRVYCRRCVGAGMGDMTEGRKCIDCLGRRYSHRYIHRAGDTSGGCCHWLCLGYYPSAKAVTAQELVWAEKGPAPRRRRPSAAAGLGSSSISTSYANSGYYNSINSASMSMTINGDNSIGGNPMPASASSSFIASYAPNPHAFPL
ncbi:hypothetical protein QOZ80_8AG0617090 [Eleusine coracana subsp. coracana]|nr:hypothetical protein QOZ80_8AG0617090 [Eleusine coracana subsp. coracana]